MQNLNLFYLTTVPANLLKYQKEALDRSCAQDGGEVVAACVIIPMARYNELVEAEDKLAALEAAGVDNWDGYDFAMEVLHGEEENDDDE